MRELVGGKNKIGRTAAVLKSPIKRPLPLPSKVEPRNLPAGKGENDEKILVSTFSVQSKIRSWHLTNESHYMSKHKSCSLYGFTEVRE